MLQKLEMFEIQDKTRLLDEMNETREAVNELEKKVDSLASKPKPVKDKELNLIVKHLEERLVKIEDNIGDLMKAEVKPKPTKKV